MKVVYDREKFIKLSNFGRELTVKYCNEHPKEFYDFDDFMRLYYLSPVIEFNGGPVGHGLWDEHNTSFDRIVNIYSRNTYGE